MKSPTTISSFRCSGLQIGKINFHFLSRRLPTKCTHFPRTRLLNSAAIRGSISTATHFLHFCRILIVRLPVPGPTSSTMSELLRFALSTILQDKSMRKGHFCVWPTPSYPWATLQMIKMSYRIYNNALIRTHNGLLRTCWPKRAVLEEQRN